ncbi:hypothetical protein STEG23_010798 [Scotinomys teguina]
MPIVTFSIWHIIKDALLTDKVKVKEQLVEAEQSLEKIQEEEVRKSVSVTDTQSEDEEESQFETKAQEVKVKVKEFSLSSSSERDSEEEERLLLILEYPILFDKPAYASQGFQKFCKRWSIQHKTGIPYNPQDAERPMWLPERCVCPVDVPADTKDHADDPDSTNIGTGAMDVVVATIAVFTTAATAVGIAVSQNVQTVTTVNVLAERESSALDLQNQRNGHLHFGLLTLNQKMALVQEKMDILWTQQHVQCARSFSSVCVNLKG